MCQDVIGGPNSSRDSIKDLQKIFEQISCPIIVEGESDRLALQRFGLEKITPLNGKPLFKVASLVSKKAETTLVLTDFDREGRKLAKKLNSFLVSFGVVPKNSLRGKIKKIVTKKGISDVENMKSLNV